MWQFTVGVRSADVDASWGTAPDLNGDGYVDVVVGAPDRNTGGRVYVHPGGANGIPIAPTTVLSDTATSRSLYGAAVASAGDVNGDGYADLVVGANLLGDDNRTGRAYVYLGGATGLASAPATTMIGAREAEQFGISVAGAGDTDRDGYADVVVGAFASGRVYVHRGGARGTAAMPETTIVGPGPTGDYFGMTVAGVGDLNGDGDVDILVGSPQAGGGTGAAHVYLGRARGPSGTPAMTLTNPTGGYFGRALANAVP